MKPLTAEQQKMVTENMGLVGAMLKLHVRRYGTRNTEEAKSAGLAALCRAARGFDPSRGFKFSTYACRSVLRGMQVEMMPRRKYADRTAKLDTDLSRVSGSRLAGCEDPKPGPEAIVAESDQMFALKNAMRDLPARHADVMLLRSKGLTLEAVGRKIGVTKERVRQIQLQTIERLRRRLRVV